jgi:nicotinate-nucleotide adenylyltransferase
MLILGGTFDPPHVGHLVLAGCASAELGEETVTLMPAGDPWRKTVATAEVRRPSPARVRLAMARLAVADANRRFGAAAPSRNDQQPVAVVVDEREIRRRGPTYTADTLAELGAEGAGEITLLLGSDALADLPNWHEPARIFELARVAVATKPGGTPFAEALALAEAAVPGCSARVVELRTVPPLAISSTMVRERVARGLPIAYLVPPSVERYIRRAGLYGARGSA